MKLLKTSKGFLALTSAVVLALPALTLTSCSNISQYCIPTMTDYSPFIVNKITDPYRTSEWGRYDTKDSTGSYELKDDKLQVPTNYLYTSGYDSNFAQAITSMYGYCDYNIPEWSHDAPEGGSSELQNKYVYNRSNDNDYAWRTLSESQLNYVTSNTLSSYQNLNIATAVTTVNTTTNYFVADFNYMNSYLNNIISQKSIDDIEKSLNYVFSGGISTTDGFKYGDDTGKSYFYQYCLDNANLLSTASSKYKFGPYNVGWNFKKVSGFGDDSLIWNGQGEDTNPYIQLQMADLTKGEYGFNEGGTYTPDDYSKPFCFPINTIITGDYMWDGKDINNPVYTYTKPKDEDGNLSNPYAKYIYTDNKVSDFASIVNIPMLIRPRHIQSAYYDPSQNLADSIQPADWLTRDSSISDIQEQLKNEGSWDEIKKTVGLSNLSVDSLTFDQRQAENTSFAIDAGLPSTNPYISWMSEDVKKAYEDGKMDPRVMEWIIKGEIEFGDWIALANYGTFVINFQYKYNNGKTQCIKALLPYFTGISTIFPAYMLFTNADCYKQVNPDADKDDWEYNKYYIEYSGSGLETDVKNIITALTDHSTLPDTSIKYKDTYDMMKNNPYFVYVWSFGKLGAQGTITVGEDTYIDPENADKYFDYINNMDCVDYSEILFDTIEYAI